MDGRDLSHIGGTFEGVLAEFFGHGEWIFAVEASQAESVLSSSRRANRAIDAQVPEGGGTDVLADPVDRHDRGRELAPAGHVDSIEAGVGDGWRRDPDVNLGRAGLKEHPHDLLGRGGPDDGVVDEDDSLAGNVFDERRQLHPHPNFPHPLVGLDEGPVDVSALHHPLSKRDLAGLGIAEGGRDSAIGNGDNEVGLDRVLLAQNCPHPLAHVVEQVPIHLAIGPSEVDELEHAHGRSLGRGALGIAHPFGIDHDHLAGFEFAFGDPANRAKGATLAGDHVSIVHPSGGEGADAKRVSESQDHPRGQNGDAVGPTEFLHHRCDGVLRSKVEISDQQTGDHLAVGGGFKDFTVGL